MSTNWLFRSRPRRRRSATRSSAATHALLAQLVVDVSCTRKSSRRKNKINFFCQPFTEDSLHLLQVHLVSGINRVADSRYLGNLGNNRRIRKLESGDFACGDQNLAT